MNDQNRTRDAENLKKFEETWSRSLGSFYVVLIPSVLELGIALQPDLRFGEFGRRNPRQTASAQDTAPLLGC